MYIVGGRILTMAGREIPEGILQIRNGKIAQVGARGEVKLQPEEGEQVVIAKNALIMPGIIEAHCRSIGVTNVTGKELFGCIGEFSQKLYDTVTGIQLGKIEDKFGWRVKVD